MRSDYDNGFVDGYAAHKNDYPLERLLDDVGAVKVNIGRLGSVYSVDSDLHIYLPEGYAWLLPVKDGGTT